METHLTETAGTWDSETGAFISESHQHLAQVLRDYNPHFSLAWIPPKDRDSTDSKPFAIIDSSPARPQYVMRYLSELEMRNPTEILEWVFNGDLSKHRAVDVFDRIASRERAEELLKLKKRDDELQDRLEFAEYVFGDHSPNTFRHNGQTYRK